MESNSNSHLQSHERVKIRFPLSKEDSEEGVEAENLWAEDLGLGRYVIDNIPLYVYGVSNQDTVTAALIGNRLCFDKVVERGGHSTYRVLLKDEAGYGSTAFQDYWQRLRVLNCSQEVARRRWVAIDVPGNSNADAVYEILELGEANGVWTFEEAHCGHPV
jgi:uncharacterized protein DUF4265